MKIIKNNIGNEIKIFAKTIEYEALEQIKEVANYEPYQNSKIRVMPDVHAGMGCTIGTTMTITDTITPNLTGVDVGCGVLTILLKDTDIDFKDLDRTIKEKVPHGFNVHKTPQTDFDFSGLRCKDKMDLKRAEKSIGTLGGGNHFIEVAKCDNNQHHLIIHSGSRKLGNDICKYYQDKAFKNLNEMGTIKKNLIEKLKKEGRENEIDNELKKIRKPSANKDLAHLTGSDFEDYMNDMEIAQKFATLNRNVIADIILKKTGLTEISRFETIHNYIDFKRMILRKGAVSAEKDEMLLIPINMRDGSLVCKGKGNEDWNYSAPHGAGRLMSRKKAKNEIKLDDFKKTMDGIHSSCVNSKTLDEAPQAYKPVEEIETSISDTVEIISKIKPVYNFKSY